MATIESRKAKDGKTTYRVRVRLKGHPVQTATFERKTDAKKWGQQIEVAIRERRHFPTREAKRHTLGEAIDRYIQHELPFKPRNRDQYNHAIRLRWWKAQIGHYALADVTSALIAEYRDKLSRNPTQQSKQRSPATVNRYLANLSHVFTIAVKEWRWLDHSPTRNVSRREESHGRTRFLSDDERPRLLAACKESQSPYLYPIVVLALSTGMRRGEILNLTWDDVNLKHRTIHLKQTKNRERRVVPLAGHALELIRQLSKVRRLDSNLLFPRKSNPQRPATIRDGWETALKKTEITDFHFHDLRHSAASYLAMNGATPSEIAAVLGHKTLQMVKRYAHLSEQHTAGVVARMNEKIFGSR